MLEGIISNSFTSSGNRKVQDRVEDDGIPRVGIVDHVGQSAGPGIEKGMDVHEALPMLKRGSAGLACGRSPQGSQHCVGVLLLLLRELGEHSPSVGRAHS